MRMLRSACAALALLGWLGATQAAEGQPPVTMTAKMCVFDPLGIKGDGFRAARDFRLEMIDEAAIDIDMKAYVDERVAVEDFKTGQCDGLMATGLRTKSFNGMAAALDSVGASNIIRNGKVDLAASYDVARRFIQLVSSPKAADMMVDGAYEVAGIFPLGAAYVFVSDRDYASLDAQVGTGRRQSVDSRLHAHDDFSGCGHGQGRPYEGHSQTPSRGGHGRFSAWSTR